MQAFADFAKAEFGRVDVLVNNAGVMPLSLMSDLKVDEWDRMIDVNIRGVLNGIAAVLPDMKARGNPARSSTSPPSARTWWFRPCRLLRHEVRGVGDLGGPAPGEHLTCA